jgi:AmmeMemoRadiSam system protein B
MNQKYKIRKIVDKIGYATTAEQMRSVVEQATARESLNIRNIQHRYGLDEDTRFLAAVCPHDDYVYAAPMYVHVIPYVKARVVVIFGVCHVAQSFGLENRLVFDSYDSWHASYGPVPVSSLREDILNEIPKEDFIVNDDAQSREHSVEAIVPFLQHYNPEVHIVSILVPYMEWNRLDELSFRLAEVLHRIITRHQWTLGNDLAFLSSLDCVHYGDQGWGDGGHDPFGTSIEGYEKAVTRDTGLTTEYLTGQLSGDNLKELFNNLVESNNPKKYRITWCGRFSVPFGLNCLLHLSDKLGVPRSHGILLKYDTSVALGELDHKSLGIGVTAPSNLHHWVGYAALGYV